MNGIKGGWDDTRPKKVRDIMKVSMCVRVCVRAHDMVQAQRASLLKLATTFIPTILFISPGLK